MYSAFSKKGKLFKGGHYSREDIIQGNTVHIMFLETFLSKPCHSGGTVRFFGQKYLLHFMIVINSKLG